MQLRVTTDYAVGLMLYLYARRDEDRTTAEEIAAAVGIPENYIQKVARKLRKANLVYSVRGQAGGYHINPAAGDITLYEVVHLMEPEKLDRCLNENGPLNAQEYGADNVRAFYRLQQERWDRALQDVTLAELSESPVVARRRAI